MILFAVFALLLVVVSFLAGAKILEKAGYSPWWVLVVLIPYLGLLAVIVFAYSDWPALRNRPAPPVG